MIPIKPSDVTWTDEQWEAIYDDNKNIIVSAGAGSGKTAVLTERVIRKLNDGVNVNQLLILTFTKAAAGEMADRIRKKIKKISKLKDQLSLLDSSYITTFDSFALSVVKKYHYLLNINNNIGIIDASVIELEKTKTLDEIFLEYYEKEDKDFLKMIKDFCTKDDKDLRNYILNISNKLDLLSNKKEYLENYLDNYYLDKTIENNISKYFNLLKKRLNQIKNTLKKISHIDNELSIKIEEVLIPLFNSKNYNDLKAHLNIKLPNAKRGSSEEVKQLKKEISLTLKELKTLTIYESEEEIKSNIMSTYPTVNVIIKIILEFDKRINKYKHDHNFYEFNDIAVLAIKIVKENKEVREELKNYFKEIMIDEYQDTNDLQEEFISMISNHNVYMVGDIKQSIYRFRNANPYIFKNKYDTYSTSKVDKKIDLNKNFRSRNEVLDNINLIFTLIMDDEIGGANYLLDHQMIFGNKAYLNKILHNNDMEIYQYSYDKSLGYSKEEIEAFFIAKDIKEKYESKYQVFDKDTSLLRDIRYEDFAIIMDRSTSFELYKKIFNYHKIPLTILKDEKMNEEDDIHVLNNIIRFIIKIYSHEYDTEFKYLFTSIMRSFLYEASDDTIFEFFINDNFQESTLYKSCQEISNRLSFLTSHELLDEIVKTFDYYNNYIKIANIHSGIVKLSKLRELAINLESLGYDVFMFSKYLNELLEVGLKIEYKIPDVGADAVKIMTIHKSKGLEYPICYFSGLYKEFNISDLKEKFLTDNEFGIIVPIFQEGIAQTIYKDLVKEKYLKEEISEKIRLFYVALTRAREKMILIKPTNEKECYICNKTVIDNDIKSGYKSFNDILNSIENRISNKYKNINIDDLLLTSDYMFNKKIKIEDSLNKVFDKINASEYQNTSSKLNTHTFSRKTNQLITKEQYHSMKLGVKIHEYLEFINLKDPNYLKVEDNFIKNLIKNFLSQPLLSSVKNAIVYQEYEFIYEDNFEEYHGVIDLMLEYVDHIDIIDYKLKHVDNDSYLKQLQGYKKYVISKKKKEVNLYLYSILDNKMINIE